VPVPCVLFARRAGHRHIHCHCAIPAGELSPDHRRWTRLRYPFFSYPGHFQSSTLFSSWVTLTAHKWVTFGDRRGSPIALVLPAWLYPGHLLSSNSSPLVDAGPGKASAEGSSVWHCPRCGATIIVVQRFSPAELSSMHILRFVLALCSLPLPRCAPAHRYIRGLTPRQHAALIRGPKGFQAENVLPL
jgi:hypothetical protein